MKIDRVIEVLSIIEILKTRTLSKKISQMFSLNGQIGLITWIEHVRSHFRWHIRWPPRWPFWHEPLLFTIYLIQNYISNTNLGSLAENIFNCAFIQINFETQEKSKLHVCTFLQNFHDNNHMNHVTC